MPISAIIIIEINTSFDFLEEILIYNIYTSDCEVSRHFFTEGPLSDRFDFPPSPCNPMGVFPLCILKISR